MYVSQKDHTSLKGLNIYALDNDDTSLSSSTEDDNETVVNDAASAPMDDVKDAKQTHPHHEEEISNDDGDDDDDVIQGLDYTSTCVESSAPENEDSLTMVATTVDQQHEGEDVDLNNADKKKRINALVQEHGGKWIQAETSQRNVIQEQSAKALGPPCTSKFCQ